MDYDYGELLGLILFSLNAVSVSIAYVINNLLVHLIND